MIVNFYMEFVMDFKVVIFIVAFILLWGIVGKCDYQNEIEIQEAKEELQEYYGDDYEIN